MNEHIQRLPYAAVEPPLPEAVMLGMDVGPWMARAEGLIAEGSRVITLRGANAVQGIDPQAASLVTGMLCHYVDGLLATGPPVALLYDGNADNRARPDIGSVFGGVADVFARDPRVTPIAVQSRSWYSPREPGAALCSAMGTPYETYVFDDGLLGGHTALTQAEPFVGYDAYQQVIVGPVGPGAYRQLQDLSEKALRRPAGAPLVDVKVVSTLNNAAIDEMLRIQRKQAAGSQQAHEAYAAKLAQRQSQPYGAFFTRDGGWAVDPEQFPGIEFTYMEVGVA